MYVQQHTEGGNALKLSATLSLFAFCREIHVVHFKRRKRTHAEDVYHSSMLVHINHSWRFLKATLGLLCSVPMMLYKALLSLSLVYASQDGSGEIDLDELRTVMTSLGYSPTDKQLEDMMAKVS